MFELFFAAEYAHLTLIGDIAKQCQQQIALPLAAQPTNPDQFPFPGFEADPLQALRAQVFDFQADGTLDLTFGLGICSRKAEDRLFLGHRPDQGFLIDVFHFTRCDGPAIAQDAVSVSNPEDFFHPVGYKNDCFVLLLPVGHQLEQALHLAAVQAGSRFVQDDQPGIQTDRL